MTEPTNPGDPQPNYGHQPNTGAQQPYPGQPYAGQPYSGQPYPGYPPVQAPKKRKKWPWILLALVLVFVAFIGGCMALIGGAAVSIDEESKRTVTVTYEVTGDGPTGSVTYSTGDVDTSQDTDVPLPWNKDVQITGLGKYVSLLASNGFDSSGAITCTIRQGGKVISENTASGPGASASCSGSAE